MRRRSQAQMRVLEHARRNKRDIDDARQLLRSEANTTLELPEIGDLKAKRLSQKRLDAIKHSYSSVNTKIRALSRRLSAALLDVAAQRNAHHQISEQLFLSRASEVSLLEKVQALTHSLETTRRELARARQERKKSVKQASRLRRAAKITYAALEDLGADLCATRLENERLGSALQAKSVESRPVSQDKLDSAICTISDLRKELTNTRRGLNRVKEKLAETRNTLDDLRTYKPTVQGRYTPEARSLSRQLILAGVKPERLREVVLLCAENFGISVRGDRFLSARTGARVVKEGGLWGLIQIGRELTNAEAFGESSDGTTMNGITQESHHYTLRAPTYEPGVDDDDPETWKHVTRFVEAHPAVNHTGEEQVKGSVALAEKAFQLYGSSSLATKDGKSGSVDPLDYFRKQIFQNLDHASDGKKKFRLIQSQKEHLREEELGRQALAEMEPEEICELLVTITNEDIAAEYTGDFFQFEMFGCCAHKEMNAAKIGTRRMHEAWVPSGRTPPVLLPNKANAAAISLSEDSSSAATLNAIESSSSGGEKLMALAGGLFHHKDHETGYQQRLRIYMDRHKRDRHGNDVTLRRFPNVSAVRFQSSLYGAIEIIKHVDLFEGLISEIVDGKVNPGANHVEANVLKGLRDIPTLTELAAMALYGEVVSRPYFAHVRGRDSEGNPLNFLDLSEFHRKIPVFCESIAANPSILWNDAEPFEKRTLRGEPFRDPALIHTIQNVAAELPDLEFAISEMFAGCAEGWIHFTPEFAPGGSIDRLTPEHRRKIFVPTTNDHNEGKLGSLRIYTRMNPTSNAFVFSDITRVRTNNTEKFIKKVATDEDHISIMREARRTEKGPSEYSQFKDTYADYQRDRAISSREHREAIKQKREKELQRLVAIGVILDSAKLKTISSQALYDQLKIYKDVLKDPTLKTVAISKITAKAPRLAAVESALARYMETLPTPPESEQNEEQRNADSHPEDQALGSPMDVDGLGEPTSASEVPDSASGNLESIEFEDYNTMNEEE